MYFYDPAGRLLESRQFRLMETFLHDPASSIVEYVTQANDGDVAAISVFSRPQQKSNGEYGKGGRLLKKREWSYEYDTRGRRTAKIRTLGETAERTEYDWDGRDKLRTIRKPDGTRLDYSYDVFGRRVSKSRSGGPLDAKRVEFVWDGEVLAFELDSETGPRAFVHEPGGFEPILQQQGGETYLCVNDHLGMPKELIDGTGRLAWAAAHSAYGKVIATQGPAELEVEGGFVSGGEPQVESPFRLLGQVNDPDAELAWTRFRCFDAKTGTWISTDPLELRGGLSLYGFEGSPTGTIDPLGLQGTSGGNHPPRKLGRGDKIHRSMKQVDGKFVSSPRGGAPNRTQKGVRTATSAQTADMKTVKSEHDMVGPGHTPDTDGLSGSVKPNPPQKGTKDGTVDAGDLPDGLEAIHDHDDHVTIKPSRPMTQGEFQDLLNQVPWQ